MGSPVLLQGWQFRAGTSIFGQPEERVVSESVLPTCASRDEAFEVTSRFRDDCSIRIGDAHRTHESSCSKMLGDRFKFAQKKLIVGCIPNGPITIDA